MQWLIQLCSNNSKTFKIDEKVLFYRKSCIDLWKNRMTPITQFYVKKLIKHESNPKTYWSVLKGLLNNKKNTIYPISIS